MDVSTVISRARSLAYINSTQFSDTQMLAILNDSYHTMENAIVRVKQDYFYDEWLTNTVVGQREYTLPIRDTDVPGCRQLLGVGIKFTTTQENFTEAKEIRPKSSTQGFDLHYLDDNNSQSYPSYQVSDLSVFIYPTPTIVIQDGIILYGISSLIDLILAPTLAQPNGGTEASIRIPVEYHYALPIAMCYYIYQQKGMLAEAQAKYTEYQAIERQMLSGIAMRVATPLSSTLPSLLSIS